MQGKKGVSLIIDGLRLSTQLIGINFIIVLFFLYIPLLEEFAEVAGALRMKFLRLFYLSAACRHDRNEMIDGYLLETRLHHYALIAISLHFLHSISKFSSIIGNHVQVEFI